MPLLPILSAIWSFASSTLGMVLIAALIGFTSGHHRASVACEKRDAEARAAAILAQKTEEVRQAKAAEAISITDRARLSADAKAADAMSAEVDRLQTELARKPAHAPARKTVDCRLDGDFIRRVRQHDAAGGH